MSADDKAENLLEHFDYILSETAIIGRSEARTKNQ